MHSFRWFVHYTPLASHCMKCMCFVDRTFWKVIHHPSPQILGSERRGRRETEMLLDVDAFIHHKHKLISYTFVFDKSLYTNVALSTLCSLLCVSFRSTL